MVKRLITFNIVIIVIIFIANVGVFHGVNYPVKFNFFYNFRDYGFENVFIVLLIIAGLTALVSSLRIKNYNFINKFLRILILINSIVLVFFIYEGINSYKINRNEYLKIEQEYIKQAQQDIQNDNVTYKYSGGFSIPECNQNIENKIDSITKIYGVKYVNTGCIIMNQYIKAEEKYTELVKPYLEKRNGKDWEEKMKSEINIVKKDCR